VQGGSTITQQLVKNFFLTTEKTIKRKLQEALFAFVLERRADKDEILELYLNEVYLGQVGSFGLHGVGEAARLYFEKDVGNLTLAESALLAALIPSPNRYNPHRYPAEALLRRNIVLDAARRARLVPAEEAREAIRQPLSVARETLHDSEAPYFVDLVKEQLEAALGPRRALYRGLAVHTTLDPHLQAAAQEALAAGLRDAERKVAGRRRGKDPAPTQRLEGSLIVLEPTTGAVVALVGGRSYERSQFNRATRALRQPGSTFKPFVYLAAFESTLDDPERPPLTPATLVEDAPTTFFSEQGEYTPANDGQRYLGFVTLRRALALSLNVATIKVAEFVGYDRVARAFSRAVERTIPPYPSVALGSFEATPLEMAGAFGVLATGGLRRPTVTWSEVRDDHDQPVQLPRSPTVRIARAESVFLVTNMMRSVVDEGTGHGVRRAGLKVDAAAKTGTTNDQRDAWFIGFTPDLLAAVWVGYDDNAPLRQSGADVALPIWAEFMKRATAGVKQGRFAAPAGITFVDIDKDTGLLAGPGCPRVYKEAFISSAVPTESCVWHESDGARMDARP
jgi:penicillin-binding protein 1B